MNTLRKPERLDFGDTVGIVAPASAPADPHAVDGAASALERLGFKPKLGKNVRARLGFIAGSDRQRATDLMAMITDKEVKAIICLRGGYGTSRILNRLDYDLIRRHRKILSGYSDITSLHFALIKKAGLVCFHAPMLNGELAEATVPPFTRAAFLRAVMEAAPAGSIRKGYAGGTACCLRGGTVEGSLIGGNLSLICASLGTPFAPSFKGKILFFEEVNEPPYRLDRMLTQLLNAGILSQVAGIAVGACHGSPIPEPKPDEEYRQSIFDVLKERLSSLHVPVVVGLPFGHSEMHATIPLGVRARLDGNQGDLIIIESAVR